MEPTCLSNCLINLFFSQWGLRKSSDFAAATKALLPLLSANYFADAAGILTFGASALAADFSVMGVSGLDAAQNFIALVSLGSLLNSDGTTWNRRSDYLYFLSNTIAGFLDPNNADLVANLGIDFEPMNEANAVDRLAVLGKTLNEARFASQFTYTFMLQSVSLTHFLDNFRAFDQIRCGLQASVPAYIAPTMVTVIHAYGKPTMGDFTDLAFGQ